MRSHYNIVVIGAGPAGLNAARVILSGGTGKSLLLIDRTIPWENPIACAEAVGKVGFASALPIQSEWIRFTINKAQFIAPDGNAITYADPGRGYIINRAKMQQDICHMITTGGGETLFGAKVISVVPFIDNLRTVQFADGSSITADIVIDASGPVSRLGSGEPISTRPFDLEPSYFAVVNGDFCTTDTVRIFRSTTLAPGGYGWIFPRTTHEANVGIVIGKAWRGKLNLPQALSEFIQAHCPGATVLWRAGGAIPCGYERRPLAVQGLIKAGDAANTVHPISRAGIVEALLSGKAAAECALHQISASSEKEIAKTCKNYEAQWYAIRGKRHQKLSKVKTDMAKIPDSDFNKAVASLSAIPQEKLTLSRIFGVAVGRSPRLVWALRHMF